MSRLTYSEKELFALIKQKRTNQFVQKFERSEYINKFCSNPMGDSLLGYAIACNATIIAEYLAQDPELINYAGKNGKPPSHYFKNDVDEAFLVDLVGKGLDLNATDATNSTVLHNMARMCSGKDFYTVVDGGADPYASNQINEIPLDTAKRWNNRDILDYNL